MSKINRNHPRGAILPLALAFERLTDAAEEAVVLRALGLSEWPESKSPLWDREVQFVWPSGHTNWEECDGAWWAEVDG